MEPGKPPATPPPDAVTPGDASPPEHLDVLDLRGEVCPYTFLKAKLALEFRPGGTRLRIVVDNEVSARDVPRSLAGAGHRIHETRVEGGLWVILVEKSGQGSPTSTSSPSTRTG